MKEENVFFICFLCVVSAFNDCYSVNGIISLCKIKTENGNDLGTKISKCNLWTKVCLPFTNSVRL